MFANNSLNVLLTFPEMQYVISQSLQIKENLIKLKKRYKWLGVCFDILRVYSFGTNERQCLPQDHHMMTASLPHSVTPPCQ